MTSNHQNERFPGENIKIYAESGGEYRDKFQLADIRALGPFWN